MTDAIDKWAVLENGVVVNYALADAAYAESQGWIAPGDSQLGSLWDGKKFAPPPLPQVSVPQIVTARQAKRALLEAGLLDDVESAIANIPDALEQRRIQIDWDESTEFRRDWPALEMLAAVMRLDEGTLDALFIEAATL